MNKGVFIFIAVLGFFAVICTRFISDKIAAEIAITESRIGKRYVVDSDTLLIVDYSVLSSTYTSSSGKTMSVSFVSKLTPIKE